MMMQMISMIHHHLQGLAEMYAGPSGMNKLLFVKATIHMLHLKLRQILQSLHVVITEAMAEVLCHLLEVVVPVTRIVMVMERIMDMGKDKGLQDIPAAVPVVVPVVVAMVAEVEDCITIIVHSCSLMMMKQNILISSLVP
jgi:hypothetical protein